MTTTKVSSKGAIVIPKNIRQKYGIEPGSRIQLLDIDGSLHLKILPKNTINYARGFLKAGKKSVLDILQETREEDKQHEEWLLNTVRKKG